MRKLLAMAAIAGAAALVTTEASAQAVDSNWVNVNARVVGIFDFQIDNDDWLDAATDAATYNFGDVSVDGTTTGTAVAAVGATSTTFTADNAFTWSVISAPRRDVTITYQNAAVANTGGSLTLADLEIDMGDDNTWVNLNGGNGTVAHPTVLNVGNGSNALTGNIDLRLTIDDQDTPGTSSYTFELVATGV